MHVRREKKVHAVAIYFSTALLRIVVSFTDDLRLAIINISAIRTTRASVQLILSKFLGLES